MRHVLVCDAGHPRNAPARIFNGFLSRDGSHPLEFLEICKGQLQRYSTVELRKVEVCRISGGRGAFVAELTGGGQVRSTMVLLATGLVDELPDLPGFLELYGKTVHSCPLCDGWEHRGESLAVLGGKQQAAELAVEMLLWNNDVVLCSNGPLECSDKTRGALTARRDSSDRDAGFRLRGERWKIAPYSLSGWFLAKAFGDVFFARAIPEDTAGKRAGL